MLRTFGKTTAKLRVMAGDFQKQFNDALKEAELDDVKKSVDSLRSLNPTAEIKKQLNPFEKAAADVRAGLDKAMKPTPEPAGEVAKPTEPLKNGAAAMPGVSGPEAMPAASPVFAAAEPASNAVTPVAKAEAPAAKPVAAKKPASAKPAAKSAASSAAKATAAKAKKTPVRAAAATKTPAAKKKSAGSAK